MTAKAKKTRKRVPRVTPGSGNVFALNYVDNNVYKHNQGAGNSLSRNVADDQPQPLATQIQEVVIIAADLAGLNT